jgi:glycosyltransferase involved in cell wall biosynthesis
MKRIALIPVYNEEATLLSVLEPVARLVDLLVVVDDGSSDRSLALAGSWARNHSHARILRLPANRGMSIALREGFIFLASQLRSGNLDPEDMVLTLDADGQHDSTEIQALCAYVEANGLDVALTRRDFSLYPFHKRLGNGIMTLWGRLWSGFHYLDVESGFRAMRLKVIPPLLDYYTGFRYSCAQEIAILTARLGFRVDNGFETVIRLYRSQTALRDVFINSALGFWAFSRWALRRKIASRMALARPAITSDPL